MGRVVGIAVISLLFAACGTSPGTGASTEGTVTKQYGPQGPQTATLHLPDGGGPHPTVVMIHGGFWLARYDAGLMTPLAEDLAARGYAVWNIEYRRVGNGGGWPATLEDVAAATDHLARIANDHPLDLDRVVAVGHSAGGQLATWLAARPGLPTDAPGADPKVAIRAVISQAGLLDLHEAAQRRLGGGSTQRFLDGSPTDVPTRYDLASPIERLPLGVPVVAVHGGDDGLVPPAQSESYVDAARQAGDDAQLVLVDGEGHFEHLDTGSGVWAVALDHLSRLTEAA